MEKPKRSIPEKIVVLGSAISALGGTLNVIAILSEQVKGYISFYPTLPSEALWIISILLLGLGFSGLNQFFSRRSRLLRPEKLLLKSNRPEHLKGREEDIIRLVKLCREEPLVWIVGDSGVGKSAILQSGLCPRLRSENLGLVPIYLDVLGSDWEAGPHNALRDALFDFLQGSKSIEQGSNIREVLTKLRNEQRRITLLLFDQFDDYQSRHRTRFVSLPDQTLLSSEELVASNSFWALMKSLIAEGIIHIVFVTRSDTASGLESVRFLQPRTYPLYRLNSDFVVPLLTELTHNDNEEGPVVYCPENGWDKLKRRFAHDLSQQGDVLPAQMKLAFKGLTHLRTLTIREYERIGGLHGLEASDIESHINNAARHTGLTTAQIRLLLLYLVDQDELKTRPRSEQELSAFLGRDGEPDITQKLRLTLDDLAEREIVRKRIDPDTRQHVWVLDHDYLCSGVMEAERRANKWVAVLETGSREFDEAESLKRKWQSLLAPWHQVALVAQRARGRFRYERFCKYALWSLGRFVPYILAFFLAGYGLLRFDAWLTANNILKDIAAHRNSPNSEEANAYWKLAASNTYTRLSFLRQMLATPANREKFSTHRPFALHASVGLDQERRKRVFTDIVLPGIKRNGDAWRACLILGFGLIDKDTSRNGLTISEFHSDSFDAIFARMKETNDSDELQRLAEVLAAVSGKLEPQGAKEAFDKILARMKETNNSYELRSLAEALAAVPGKLNEQAIIDLLKWPLTVGDVRTSLLRKLEQQTNQKFNDNIWEMVDWAEGQGLDVRSDPVRPE